MDIIDFADRIEKELAEKVPVRLGVNKLNELKRLVYEICICKGIGPEKVIMDASASCDQDERGRFFHDLKMSLVKMRYPSADNCQNLRIMPLKPGGVLEETIFFEGELLPKNIYVEKQASGMSWTREFIKKFSDIPVTEIENIGEYLKKMKGQDLISSYTRRRENIFITCAKSSFIKICPCTKDALRCGYWILNLGFGCPFDCSYCYLQNYSNLPGMVFTANLDDYHKSILDLDASVTPGLRIGTGEFTDSLALDKYTGYSRELIAMFREAKNLVLELKTKTADIDNVLKEDAPENVVISWSINTPEMADRYEKGASPIKDRIGSALMAANKGYKLGFHFDPIIFHEGWKNEYRKITEELFAHKEIRERTVWISLGTLRYTPGLKQTSERRFKDNKLFYWGEFFLDFDGKFRYPRKLRREIYSELISYIRDSGVSSWIYLCMEPETMARDLGL